MNPYIIPPPPKLRPRCEMLIMLALWTASALTTAALIVIGYTILH